jgi:hypothetical protein
MKDINLLHVLAPGCHPEGLGQIKGIQVTPFVGMNKVLKF